MPSHANSTILRGYVVEVLSFSKILKIAKQKADIAAQQKQIDDLKEKVELLTFKWLDPKAGIATNPLQFICTAGFKKFDCGTSCIK